MGNQVKADDVIVHRSPNSDAFCLQYKDNKGKVWTCNAMTFQSEEQVKRAVNSFIADVEKKINSKNE